MTWIDDVKKRCDAATPGPWFDAGDGQIQDRPGRNAILLWAEGPGMTDEDQRFVIAARTDLPFALSMLREMADHCRALLESPDKRERECGGTVPWVNAWLVRLDRGPEAENTSP